LKDMRVRVGIGCRVGGLFLTMGSVCVYMYVGREGG